MGSSIYHIGFQFANLYQNQEMEVLTQAMYHARELAMTRMEEEADMLGADGIVGSAPGSDPLRVGREPGRVHGRSARRSSTAAASTTARRTTGRLHPT